MTYTIEKHRWLNHGAGATVVDTAGKPIRFSNLNNINTLEVSILNSDGKPAETVPVPLDEFVRALNKIGFEATARTSDGKLLSAKPEFEEEDLGAQLYVNPWDATDLQVRDVDGDYTPVGIEYGTWDGTFRSDVELLRSGYRPATVTAA